MITKAWNYIQQQFKKVNPPNETLTVIPFIQEQRINQQPSFDSNKTEKKLTFSLVQQSPSDKRVEYTIKVENDQELKEKMRNDSEDLQYSHSIIDELRQLQRQIQKMSLHERKLQQIQSKVKIYDHQKPTINIRQSFPSNQADARKKYIEDVQQFRGCKYKNQLHNYPKITYAKYKEVYFYWREKRRGQAQIKKTQFESVKKLTYKSFGLLDHGLWLNDDIVSMYIELMDKEITNNKYKLLNSFFATTTLSKAENMIQRVLKKKNIDKNNTIILPVNNGNHWYFTKIQPNKMTIYDSLSQDKKSNEKSNQTKINQYLGNSIIRNILKFGKTLYEGELQLVICRQFPQQFNGYDCGVFMLMGIKDAIRQAGWSFRQGDIFFKRIQIACQILAEKLLINEGVDQEQMDDD